MKRMLKTVGTVVLAAGLSLGAYLGTIQLTGNFHEVLPKQLYRSNQPSAAEIENYASRYGIKTIINLRGKNESQPWYRAEVTKAAEMGMKHVDFRMSAYRQLSVGEIARLTQIMRDAPKPILIHCMSGADRTGLASVIYLSQIADIDEARAESQLSIRFGHIAIPHLSRAYAMDESWENFERQMTLPPDQS